MIILKRYISLLLIAAFLWQDVVWACPDTKCLGAPSIFQPMTVQFAQKQLEGLLVGVINKISPSKLIATDESGFSYCLRPNRAGVAYEVDFNGKRSADGTNTLIVPCAISFGGKDRFYDAVLGLDAKTVILVNASLYKEDVRIVQQENGFHLYFPHGKEVFVQAKKNWALGPSLIRAFTGALGGYGMECHIQDGTPYIHFLDPNTGRKARLNMANVTQAEIARLIDDLLRARVEAVKPEPDITASQDTNVQKAALLEPAPVLVLNSGSSSVKYKVMDMRDEKVLVEGKVDRIGENGQCPNHTEAIRSILKLLEEKHAIRPVAVGHRVVHGGGLTVSMVIDEGVINVIRENIIRAPEHNPHNLAGILACMELLPGVPQIAVFDTAFHSSIPESNRIYAIPKPVSEEFDIQRTGYHGISYSYVFPETAKQLGKTEADTNAIIAHLGNGCSMVAVKNGKSFNTSMGFTPLEGLIMGTRSGTIPADIILHILKMWARNDAAAGIEVLLKKATDMLNKESGLLGLSGLSNDVRDLLQARKDGHALAAFALDQFAKSAARQISAYYAELDGKVDAVVFTAGIGENAIELREEIIAKLPAYIRNSVRFMEIRTNEELVIARDTFRLIKDNLANLAAKPQAKALDITRIDLGDKTRGYIFDMPLNAVYQPAGPVLFGAHDTWVDSLEKKDVDARVEEAAEEVIRIVDEYKRLYGVASPVAFISYWSTKNGEGFTEEYQIPLLMEKVRAAVLSKRPDIIITGQGTQQIDAALIPDTHVSKIYPGQDPKEFFKSEVAPKGFPPRIFIFSNFHALEVIKDTVAYLHELKTSVTADDSLIEKHKIDLENMARSKGAHIVIPEALNPLVLKAVSEYLRKKIGEVTLLGNEEQIKTLAKAKGLNIDGAKFRDPMDGRMDKDEWKESAIALYRKAHPKAADISDNAVWAVLKKRGIDFMKRKQEQKIKAGLIRGPEDLYYGAWMVATGQADAMAVGKVYDSEHVIIAMNRLAGMEEGVSVTSAGEFYCTPYKHIGSDGRFILSDVTTTACPNAKGLADIAVNTARTVQRLMSCDAKIAFISEKGAASEKIQEAIALARTILGDRVAETPMGADEALRAGYNGLIAPDLDTANPLYKTFQWICGFKAMCLVTGGCKASIHDLSRGATAEEIETTMQAASWLADKPVTAQATPEEKETDQSISEPVKANLYDRIILWFKATKARVKAFMELWKDGNDGKEGIPEEGPKPPSILESAKILLLDTARKMNMHPVLRNMIMNPKRVTTVNFDIKLHTGETVKFWAFRALQNDARGAGKGGLRWLVGHGESLEEAKLTAVGLATLMTVKNSVIGIPYGGGKGDVFVEDRQYTDEDKALIMRAFSRELTKAGAIGTYVDVPAPDVGTDARMMVWFLDEHLRTLAEMGAMTDKVIEADLKEVSPSADPKISPYVNKVFEILGHDKEGMRYCPEIGVVTGKEVGKGGSKGRTKATGFGGFIAFKALLGHLKKNVDAVEGHPVTWRLNSKTKDVIRKDIKDITIAIQGSGNVGEYNAWEFFKTGAKVTIFQDATGTIYNENGIDIEVLSETIGRTSDGRWLPFSKLPSEYFERTGSRFIEDKTFIWTHYTDVKVPAARENQITVSNAGSVNCGIILELANNPTTPQADKALYERGILVMPDVLANVGGVTVSYFEWLQNIEGRYWTGISVDKMLEGRINKESESVFKIAEANACSLREAAFRLSLSRVANAEIARSPLLRFLFWLKKIFRKGPPYKGYDILNLDPETVEELVIVKRSGRYAELINKNEEVHTREVNDILASIETRLPLGQRGFVLVGGPVTGGKIAFSERIERELAKRGRKTRRIDTDQLIQGYALQGLLEGYTDKAIHIMRLNDMRHILHSAIRKPKEEDDTVYILEGDYVLSQALLKPGKGLLEGENRFSVFVNTAPSLKLERNMPLTSVDLRLLRHILTFTRKFGRKPLDIIRQWPADRAHNLRYVYPTWKNADVTFNSYLPYELPVIKPHVLPLLGEAYSEALKASDARSVREIDRLFALLKGVPSVNMDSKVPQGSIIRQFIDGKKPWYRVNVKYLAAGIVVVMSAIIVAVTGIHITKEALYMVLSGAPLVLGMALSREQEADDAVLRLREREAWELVVSAFDYVESFTVNTLQYFRKRKIIVDEDDFRDYIQEVVLRAAQRYETDRNTKFTTYITPRLNGAAMDYIRERVGKNGLTKTINMSSLGEEADFDLKITDFRKDETSDTEIEELEHVLAKMVIALGYSDQFAANAADVIIKYGIEHLTCQEIALAKRISPSNVHNIIMKVRTAMIDGGYADVVGFALSGDLTVSEIMRHIGLGEISRAKKKVAEEVAKAERKKRPARREEFVEGILQKRVTYAMLKPDALERKLGPKIIKRLEEKFDVYIGTPVKMKEADARRFYRIHSRKKWFPELMGYVTRGKCVPLYCELKDPNEGDASAVLRRIIEPIRNEVVYVKGKPFTFGENGVHGSDSWRCALKETAAIERATRGPKKDEPLPVEVSRAPPVRDMRKADMLAKNIIEQVMSMLLSQEKADVGAKVKERKLVLAFHSGMKWQDKTATGLLLDALVSLKESDELKVFLKNLEIVKTFDTPGQLKDKLHILGVDASDDTNNLVIAFAPEGKKGELEAMAGAVKSILVNEPDNFDPAQAYYPLLEMVLIALLKYTRKADGQYYSDAEINAMLKTAGTDIKALNIADFGLKDGFLIFKLIPRASPYLFGERQKHDLLIRKFIRTAA